mmetsp:Transcript_82420/g.238046  ORF Transcript_82420/g.238046 Transcript_82420/m.238046 type:complete len:209 (-) Transcript_82420:315-941(-)
MGSPKKASCIRPEFTTCPPESMRRRTSQDSHDICSSPFTTRSRSRASCCARHFRRACISCRRPPTSKKKQQKSIMMLSRHVSEGIVVPKQKTTSGYMAPPAAGTSHMMWERIGMNKLTEITVPIMEMAPVTSPVCICSQSAPSAQTSAGSAPANFAAWYIVAKKISATVCKLCTTAIISKFSMVTWPCIRRTQQAMIMRELTTLHAAT